MKLQELREFFKEDMSCDLAIHLTSNLNWHRYEQQVGILAGDIRKNSVVLDVGCGTGAQAVMLSVLRPDLTIYATDIDYHESWQNLRRFKIKFSKDNAEHMNFRDNVFDAVISFGVLEHLDHPENFLKEVKRVGRHHALFYIFNLPNKYSINEFLADRIGISPHKNRYTVKSINKMLWDNDFRVMWDKREFLIPSLVNLYSKKLGNMFNKTYRFLDMLDKIIILTPLNYFAQSIEIISEVRK